jgi:hypothetical protein
VTFSCFGLACAHGHGSCDENIMHRCHRFQRRVDLCSQGPRCGAERVTTEGSQWGHVLASDLKVAPILGLA